MKKPYSWVNIAASLSLPTEKWGSVLPALANSPSRALTSKPLFPGLHSTLSLAWFLQPSSPPL